MRVFGNANAQDVFAVVADKNAILGELTFTGVGGWDYAYYYDYMNQSSQTYTVSSDLTKPTQQYVDRTGLGRVTFADLYHVILVTSRTGGNTVNVEGTRAGASIVIAASNGDVVIVGKPVG